MAFNDRVKNEQVVKNVNNSKKKIKSSALRKNIWSLCIFLSHLPFPLISDIFCRMNEWSKIITWLEERGVFTEKFLFTWFRLKSADLYFHAAVDLDFLFRIRKKVTSYPMAEICSEDSIASWWFTSHITWNKGVTHTFIINTITSTLHELSNLYGITVWGICIPIQSTSSVFQPHWW